MVTQMKIRVLFALALLSVLSISGRQALDKPPKNFHVIEEEVLYRSGQPNGRGMEYLQAMGIKTVLNLRYHFGDKHEVRNTSLKMIWLKMKAMEITLEDMENGLIAIRDAQKPVLIHCYHGSDRTGCLAACYRMVFQDWPREKAIEEFRREDYGYNYRWFPNLLEFLEEVDVTALKAKILGTEER